MRFLRNFIQKPVNHVKEINQAAATGKNKKSKIIV